MSEFPLMECQGRPLGCGQSQEGNLLRHKGNTSVTTSTEMTLIVCINASEQSTANTLRFHAVAQQVWPFLPLQPNSH